MESSRAEAIMKTMAEVLKEQGRQIGLAEGEAKGLAKGEAKGEAKGLAKALLRLLEAKGMRVDDTSRQRIQSCTEVSVLERWLERALSAARLSEVLDAPVQ
jgi:flagellar biosynthesis/type III secretory pathway protein FliH